MKNENHIYPSAAVGCPMAVFLTMVVLCWLWQACEADHTPDYLMPTVEVGEAQNITRTTAQLMGSVQTAGTGAVSVLRFRYGTSDALEKEVECNPQQLDSVSATLEELTPNTIYFYCLEAGNGSSSVQSDVRSFTTQPNQLPTIASLRMLHHGPLSITLQCVVKDNGGEPLTSIGFCYQAANGEEQRCAADLATDLVGDSLFRSRISGLQMETDYTIQAYVANSVGETRSETFSFHTQQTVMLTTAGTLSEAMGSDEQYLYNKLNISGPLNGTDIRFLRNMAGVDVEGEATGGQLADIDLTDANIVSGGLSYDGMRYTTDSVVGQGMFANCPYLQRIVLPVGTVRIEEDAFTGSVLLQSLSIPAATTQVSPSSCESLETITVSEGNAVFADCDGALYDAAYTTLLWFPEGKITVDSFPSTLSTIGEQAFRRCQLKQIVLPSLVTEIKQGAFYGALLESIVLPDGIERLPVGTFQGCSRLTTVSLGYRTSYLSSYCFDGCPLENLYVYATDFPPMCNETTFTDAIYETCTLNVPTGCRKLYRNSTYWGKFETIVEF
ncbi:MAG: leucine-rich repeat protein [Bacteroides sp.]|nr:leucine-rich repeat protein [Bacteroides sp.]